MNETPFDLVVIGAGPGGYVAAIRASQLGMRVACIEKESWLGGTCLNVGCIPSKALLDSSELFHQARMTFARHGIRLAPPQLDLPVMMARKDQVVETMNRGVASLFRKNKIEHVRGIARLVSPTTVAVRTTNGKKELQTRHILIATGSAPAALANLPFDGKHVVSSTEALRLPEPPRRLVVIGAGAVGLELGSVWSRLGTDVLVIEFMDRILPGMDRELTAQLQRSLEKQGLHFRLKTSAERAEIEQGKIRVTLGAGDQRNTEECDLVLVAVGRRAYTEELGARDVGMKLDEKGRIAVNDQYATSVPGIYAIGDVIAGPMLAHKAQEEGVAATEIMAGQPGHVNYDAIPNVVYTYPELASVGLSEEDARTRGFDVRVGKFPFAANGRARCLDATEGLVKVVGDAKSDRLLGVHILGPRASDLIAEAAVAIEFGASVEDLARSVHAHPTLPEAIKEAALALDKRAIHI